MLRVSGCAPHLLRSHVHVAVQWKRHHVLGLHAVLFPLEAHSLHCRHWRQHTALPHASTCRAPTLHAPPPLQAHGRGALGHH